MTITNIRFWSEASISQKYTCTIPNDITLLHNTSINKLTDIEIWIDSNITDKILKKIGILNTANQNNNSTENEFLEGKVLLKGKISNLKYVPQNYVTL